MNDRLTIADLLRELEPDITRSALRRYDDNPDVQRLLGKDDKTYPVDSLQWWHKIVEARNQEPPLVRPETAHIFLEGIMENPQQSLAVVRPSAISTVPDRESLDRYANALLRHAQALECQPPPDDTLLTIKAAHEAYGVSMSALHDMSIKERGRRKVKRSVVLRYIEGL